MSIHSGDDTAAYPSQQTSRDAVSFLRPPPPPSPLLFLEPIFPSRTWSSIGSHVVLELFLTGRYLPVVLDNGHNSKSTAVRRIEEIARDELGCVVILPLDSSLYPVLILSPSSCPFLSLSDPSPSALFLPESPSSSMRVLRKDTTSVHPHPPYT